jgi:hypothetical protein
MRVGESRVAWGEAGRTLNVPSHVLVAFCTVAHIFKHVNMVGNSGIFCFRPLINGVF